MAKLSTAIVSLALLCNGVSALVPSNVPKTKRPAFDAKRAATNTMAAASIASALVIGPMADAVDMAMDTPSFGSSSLVAERVTREGLYREYDVDVGDQVFDDARSTYKSAKETKTKKGKIWLAETLIYIITKCTLSLNCSFVLFWFFTGKYTALIAVLVVGSFIIPMAQYFWYVKDDDSSDKFFAKAAEPEPEPEPKKKKWF